MATSAAPKKPHTDNNADWRKKLGAWLTTLIDWIFELRIVRAVMRYMLVRGKVLAGGIAFLAIFAITGALSIAFTIFVYFLGRNNDLKYAIFTSIDEMLPGLLIIPGQEGGIIHPSILVIDNPINPLSILSLLVLLWSSSSLMTGLRLSIQSVFGISRLSRPYPLAKIIDISGFIILAAGAVGSIVLTTLVTQFGEIFFQLLDIVPGVGTWTMKAAPLGIAFVVDSLVFLYLFRVMAGVRAPFIDLVMGAFLGGLLSSLLRLLGTSVIASFSNNPLLAGFGALVTLLLWVNLIARATLIVAAYTANPPPPGKVVPSQLEYVKELPNYVTYTRPETLDYAFDPVSGVVLPNEEEDEVVVPEWKGLVARRMRKKIDRAQAKVDQAQEELVQLEAEYAQGAWDACCKRTRPTTSSKLAAMDPVEAMTEHVKQATAEAKRAELKAKRRLARREWIARHKSRISGKGRND
ncbi:MAG: YhjD/YihY/BrkB family envelope integrity protein [Arcanobacterium sp.]